MLYANACQPNKAVFSKISRGLYLLVSEFHRGFRNRYSAMYSWASVRTPTRTPATTDDGQFIKSVGPDIVRPTDDFVSSCEMLYKINNVISLKIVSIGNIVLFLR